MSQNLFDYLLERFVAECLEAEVSPPDAPATRAGAEDFAAFAKRTLQDNPPVGMNYDEGLTLVLQDGASVHVYSHAEVQGTMADSGEVAVTKPKEVRRMGRDAMKTDSSSVEVTTGRNAKPEVKRV